MGQQKKYNQEEVDDLFKQLEKTTPEELVKKVRENDGKLEKSEEEESTN